MLQLSNAYLSKKILSLHNGAVIGVAINPVINPENLKIEGWFSTDRYSGEDCVLLVQDVREYTKDGLIVNSHDALTPPDDLVRLRKILDIQFDVIGKQVKTESKTRLGTVADYAVDSESMRIIKLYIDPPLLRSFSLQQAQKIVDRSNIVEITDNEIIVNDSFVKNRFQAPITAGA